MDANLTLGNEMALTGIIEEDEMRGKYLTFFVAKGEYGIEIRHINDIIGVQDITPVPNTQAFVKGIFNSRGSVVPVIDLRLRFGLEETEYTDRTCIIVIDKEDMKVGLIVDEVCEVVAISDGNIQPPPKITTTNASNYFIKAIGSADSGVKQLLDIDKIFGEGIAAEDE